MLAPEGDKSLARLLAGGIQAKRRVRRIVAAQHPGAWRCAVRGMGEERADRGFYQLTRDAARAEQDGFAILKTDDRALDPDRAGAAIQHARDAPLKSVDDVARLGRADGARGVGARRGERQAAGAEKFERKTVPRHTNGERLKPGAREPRDGAVLSSWQHEGERARPEFPGEPARQRIEGDIALRLLQRGDVDDQRIEARPAFRR